MQAIGLYVILWYRVLITIVEWDCMSLLDVIRNINGADNTCLRHIYILSAVNNSLLVIYANMVKWLVPVIMKTILASNTIYRRTCALYNILGVLALIEVDKINVVHVCSYLYEVLPFCLLPRNISPLVLDQNYINLKNQVIKGERRVLKELGFCVHVKHPHKVSMHFFLPIKIFMLYIFYLTIVF